MKIGLLTTSYPRDDDDPAGHFVAAHAAWLAAHVGDVDVVATVPTPGGLPFALKRNPALAATITAGFVRATLAHAGSWDAVVCHWLVPCGVIGSVLPVERRVLVAHGSDVALLHRLPLGPTWLRWAARRSHLVYVDASLRVAGAAGVVQPMPAMPAELRPSREEARRALGLARDQKVALFLGRLSPEKGCDVLLDALPPDWTLLVAGEGPQRLDAHETVRSGRARLLGLVLGRAKAELLAAADLLVVPSRRDGAPTVIAEAHAAGLPVLGTRVGGIPARVGTGGWLCEPTAASLRAALTASLPPADLPTPPSWLDAGPRLWPFERGRPGVVRMWRVGFGNDPPGPASNP